MAKSNKHDVSEERDYDQDHEYHDHHHAHPKNTTSYILVGLVLFIISLLFLIYIMPLIRE